MMNKPYSEACDQNRDAILTVIEPLLESHRQILEIGSGTGQHAIFFAGQMPHLTWQCSDREENLSGIRLWLNDANLDNTPAPLNLNTINGKWPKIKVDAVFSANTVHIMGWTEVQAMFKGIGALLQPDGLFLLYGPFNYGGKFTSESNARFESWLKSRDSRSGIRNFEDLQRLAEQEGMVLLQDDEMPANNRILSWRKTA